jgi:hypothetical protein
VPAVYAEIKLILAKNREFLRQRAVIYATGGRLTKNKLSKPSIVDITAMQSNKKLIMNILDD